MMKKRMSKLLVMALSITMFVMPFYSYGSSNSLNVDLKSVSRPEGEQPIIKKAASSTTKCYTISTGNTQVYSDTGLTKKYGTIYDTDELTVGTVKSSYSKVTYPIAGGKTKTGYIKTSAILLSTTGSSYTSGGKVTTYKRPGGAEYGYISKGDKVTKLGVKGSYTQVRYPVSGGYKYGFIRGGNDSNTTNKPLYEGKCGDNVKYRLDSNKILTISGTGKMDQYNDNQAPWMKGGWASRFNRVIIQNGVTSIGEYAFSNCASLGSITMPNGLKSIGHHAFASCSNLKNISIPGSVTSIGMTAFASSGITSAAIPKGVTKIEDRTFYNCSRLTNVSIPNTVTSIGIRAFYNCVELKSISLPSGIKRIENDAFSKCNKVTKVTIPGSVTSFGSAFSDCSGLTSVAIPNSIKTLERNAFSKCIKLASVTIPKSVTSIDSYAFEDCKGLTSLTIPNSVISVGKNAFINCSNLKKVSYSGSKSQWGSINIGTGNQYLLNASISFGITTPTNPTTPNPGDGEIDEEDPEESGDEEIDEEDPEDPGDEEIDEEDPEEPGDGEIDEEDPEEPDDGETNPEDPDDEQTDVPYDLTHAGIEVDDAVYTGSPRTPQVLVYDSDGEIINPDDYELVWENNINAGTATVTAIADNDAYTGSVSETFEIEKCSISNAQIKGAKGKTYTGKSLKPNLTVKVRGRTLKRGKDYTLSYKNNNKLGAAKVTIKGRGNYADSVAKSFLIKPAKASIAQLQKKHKQITISVKQQNGATWYQARYQTKGDSGKTVKSSKQTIVVKSLKSGRLYNVRVRVCKTVNGKSYWGAYSRAMKVRVK